MWSVTLDSRHILLFLFLRRKSTKVCLLFPFSGYHYSEFIKNITIYISRNNWRLHSLWGADLLTTLYNNFTIYQEFVALLKHSYSFENNEHPRMVPPLKEFHCLCLRKTSSATRGRHKTSLWQSLCVSAQTNNLWGQRMPLISRYKQSPGECLVDGGVVFRHTRDSASAFLFQVWTQLPRGFP